MSGHSHQRELHLCVFLMFLLAKYISRFSSRNLAANVGKAASSTCCLSNPNAVDVVLELPCRVARKADDMNFEPGPALGRSARWIHPQSTYIARGAIRSSKTRITASLKSLMKDARRCVRPRNSATNEWIPATTSVDAPVHFVQIARAIPAPAVAVLRNHLLERGA